MVCGFFHSWGRKDLEWQEPVMVMLKRIFIFYGKEGGEENGCMEAD